MTFDEVRARLFDLSIKDQMKMLNELIQAMYTTLNSQRETIEALAYKISELEDE